MRVEVDFLEFEVFGFDFLFGRDVGGEVEVVLLGVGL